MPGADHGERAPARAYHHGDLRRSLIGAAREMLREGDLAGLTLRKVAARAGVSHAAPYHHFRSKEALLAAVAEEGFGALRSALDRACPNRAMRPADRLQALGRAYVQFAVDHPASFHVMFQAERAVGTYPALDAARRAALLPVLDATALLCNRPRRHPDVQEAGLMEWALMHGLAVLWIAGPLESVHEGVRPADLAERWITRFLAATAA